MHILNILWVVFGIGLTLTPNLRFKTNSMVAPLLAAPSVGMLAGMDLMELLRTAESGFGSMLDGLATIVMFGTVIGKPMVDFRVTHQVAHTLLARLGLRYVRLSVIITGLISGLAMFYEAVFIMLAPLVIVVAAEARVPFLKLATPAIAVATATHSLFPPQPGPVALVNAYGTGMGMVYIYGTLVTTPSVICARLILPRFLGNLDHPTSSSMEVDVSVDQNNLPFSRVSILVPLTPAVIMISTTVANIWLVKETQVREVVNFLDSSPTAMSIAMVVAFVLFSIAHGHDMQWVINASEDTVKSIAMVILVIGAGGVLKQTIIGIDIGDTIDMLMLHGNISPYITVWLITVLIRLATGQGVVSAMTAAGITSAAILDPAIDQPVGVDPALLILATAAGFNTLTHIDDASFWLLKGRFGLSVKDMLETWGLLELVNSVAGLIIALIISMIV